MIYYFKNMHLEINNFTVLWNIWFQSVVPIDFCFTTYEKISIMLQINNYNVYVLWNSIWVLLPTIIYLSICILISPYRQLFFFWPKWWWKKKPTVEEEPTQEELEKIRGEMEEFFQENDEEIFDSCYKSNFPNDDPEDDKKTWWDRNKAKVLKATVFILLALLALFVFTYDTPPPPPDTSSSSSSQLEIPNNPETQAAAPLTFEEKREYRKYIRFLNNISVDLSIFQKDLNQGVFEGAEIPYQITATITNLDYTKTQLESVTNPREKFELYKSFYDKRVSHIAYAMLREINR